MGRLQIERLITVIGLAVLLLLQMLVGTHAAGPQEAGQAPGSASQMGPLSVSRKILELSPIDEMKSGTAVKSEPKQPQKQLLSGRHKAKATGSGLAVPAASSSSSEHEQRAERLSHHVDYAGPGSHPPHGH